jgi:hypothetical protein
MTDDVFAVVERHVATQALIDTGREPTPEAVAVEVARRAVEDQLATSQQRIESALATVSLLAAELPDDEHVQAAVWHLRERLRIIAGRTA